MKIIFFGTISKYIINIDFFKNKSDFRLNAFFIGVFKIFTLHLWRLYGKITFLCDGDY